jgi:hypothetical protein
MIAGSLPQIDGVKIIQARIATGCSGKADSGKGKL